jgi:hypothetical protein
VKHPEKEIQMSTIDRYIHEVGRHLPRKNRADIQTELRSLLNDSLEGQGEVEPTENDVLELLKEFGAPRKVAASYYPEGQYLIGPRLYPLFKMIAGITLAAVLGAHLLAWFVTGFIAQESIGLLNALFALLSSLPQTLGVVVIVFAILERFEVRPDLDAGEWDPASLPEISKTETVKKGERIFGISAGIIILVILGFFPDKIGSITFPGGTFFANPVIPEFIGWISISLIASISLDLFLLWQGRWTTISRSIRLAVNLLSISVLFLLYQGHSAWLAAHGSTGFFSAIEMISENLTAGSQMVGMEAFRMAMGIALIVTVLETVGMGFRMLQSGLKNQGFSSKLPFGES